VTEGETRYRGLTLGIWLGLAGAVALGPAAALGQKDSLPGLVRAGGYRADRVVAIRQAAPRQPGTGPVYEVEDFALLDPELPQGEGRELVQGYCSLCHSVRYIPLQPPLPAEQWEAVVRKMVDVHGAQIPPAIAQQIAAYLSVHYGPTRPGVRSLPP
jgi:hypothetical protein